MRFLHTADWQLGKPFANIEDVEKRSWLQRERIAVVERIGAFAREHGSEMILVAGDLFDSPSASKTTVAAACSAIGQLEVPVLVIPGNHDHGGPGSLWEQEFFERERESLAPNLHVLLKAEPLVLDSAIVFPCPLSHRAESLDTTAWLRSREAFAKGAPDKVRIVMAHGSTRSFSGQAGNGEGAAANQIDIERIPEEEYDYLALGDWHGTKQAGSKAWYSGTPELDRFPKGADNDPGNVLLVEARRGMVPEVVSKRTARLRWSELAFDFSGDAALDLLREQLTGLIGQRANEDLLHLRLSGSVGIDASAELEKLLESLRARLMRLKLEDATVIAPTDEEVRALTERGDDPLIARVARQLLARTGGEGDEAQTARIALRELHAAARRAF